MSKTHLTEKLKGFGSSDAKWIHHYGATGHLSQTGLRRVAEVKGLIDRQDWSTKATALGNKVEDEIFALIEQSFPEAKSNPKHSFYGHSYQQFTVTGHIDFVVKLETPLNPHTDKSIWIELKASKDKTEKVERDYQCQNAWHIMTIESNDLDARLELWHYKTDDSMSPENFVFDVTKITKKELSKPAYRQTIEIINRGLDLLEKNWDNLEYVEREVLELSDREMREVEAFTKLDELIRYKSSVEAEILEIRERLKTNMEDRGIKTIKTPSYTISHKQASVRKGSLDTTKLKEDYPELDLESYRKSPTPIKASIAIKANKLKQIA